MKEYDLKIKKPKKARKPYIRYSFNKKKKVEEVQEVAEIRVETTQKDFKNVANFRAIHDNILRDTGVDISYELYIQAVDTAHVILGNNAKLAYMADILLRQDITMQEYFGKDGILSRYIEAKQQGLNDIEFKTNLREEITKDRFSGLLDKYGNEKVDYNDDDSITLNDLVDKMISRDIKYSQFIEELNKFKKTNPEYLKEEKYASGRKK